MTSKGILVVGFVLFGGAVYGLHTEKMRVVTTCRDSRLFMDGSIDATIEAGGLNFHHTINIYRRHLKEEIFLGKVDVTSESPRGATQEIYSAPTMKFSLLKDRPASEYGTPARLEAQLEKEKISVSLLCSRK